MLCCKDSPATGFARVEVATVIDHCTNILKTINNKRARMRNNFVKETLESKMWWWNHLWKWLLFPKPTRRDALFTYFHGGSPFPYCMDVHMTNGRQQMTLEDLLRAAKNAKGKWMWLSAESCRACDL